MNKYHWRKNFTAVYSHQEKKIRGKLAVKTRELHWLETCSPVVILVSIHSLFHEEIGGDLKMNALLSIIKSHVKGNVTVLFSDRAHLQTISLNYQENLDLALEECLKDAKRLSCRYQPYFEDCKVVYWHSYITQDKHFSFSLNFIKDAYQADLSFKNLIDLDAESTYTNERREKYSNKKLFIAKAREDLLEQCASLLVLSYKGYRFQFYPGKPYSSVEYVNNYFIPENRRVSWIDVFLTMEKKIIMI